MTLTNLQVEQIVLVLACLLSLSGSFLMILYYIWKGQKNNYAQQLICSMALSDLIYSSTNLGYELTGLFYDQMMEWQCFLEAVFLQFAELSSFILNFLLMLCIYKSVIEKKKDFKFQQKWFIVYGYVIPGIISVIPLFGRIYGNRNLECGYKASNIEDAILAKSEALLFFYIPLWIFSIINIQLISRVATFISKLRKDQNNTAEEGFVIQDQEIEISYNILQIMFAYPIIMMICWLPLSIHELSLLFGKSIGQLEFVMYLLPDMIGSMNAIVYYYNVNQFKQREKLIEVEKEQQLGKIEQTNSRASFASSQFSNGDNISFDF